ncbi:profilin [Anaeramoeba flamelloides]|uniref:Profilin n=1 Tax=Anaeramoeba flamelloides TaxID=1746091 RepID=A0AAV7ZSX3_9EUKA|nr:profilin [Anaeramoeba flamelloides]KAJ6226521.1 profilin [Anaeramoeba flamelloides]
MSWQEYLNNNLVNTGTVSSACILSLTGEMYASSEDFSLSSGEGHKLVQAFEDYTTILATGFYVSEQKFMVSRAEQNMILGRAGEKGIICIKTNQTIVVGIYNENTLEALKSVKKLAGYLTKQEY